MQDLLGRRRDGPSEEWRNGIGPRSIKLPNGEIRFRAADLDKWLRDHEEAAA